MKFGEHLGSDTAKILAKFQQDLITGNINSMGPSCRLIAGCCMFSGVTSWPGIYTIVDVPSATIYSSQEKWEVH